MEIFREERRGEGERVCAEPVRHEKLQRVSFRPSVGFRSQPEE